MVHDRLERVGELVRRELSALLLEGSLRDPRLADVSGVAITAAEVSADLSSARVFVDVLDPSRRDAVLAALGAASGRLQRALGRRVRLKRTPRLTFHYDVSIERGRRIEALLREVRAGADEAPSDEP